MVSIETGQTVAVSDLRSMVAALRAQDCLVEITSEVDPVHELGAVLHACERAGKAAMFHKVKGHQIPVVGSVLGSYERIAIALGCEPQQIHQRMVAGRAAPTPPEVVDSGQVQEVVADGDIDLATIPIPTHAPLDGGPFINAGIVIARDPESGRHNLSFNRMQIFDRDLAGVNMNVWRDVREFFLKAEAAGENLPFCVAIGVDPVLLIAGASKYEGDEYEIAGGLRGAPVPVVRALSCDVLVPALAEIVLEGEVLAGERREEGPMAEFTGHYSGTGPQTVARIKVITTRRDPIFETIAGASFEHLILGNAVTREPLLDAAVRKLSPRIGQVYLPPYACGFTAIISMRGPEPGEPQTVGFAALASHVNVKTVIIVDDDVDIFDPADVMWALSTRVRWDQGSLVAPHARGNDLDPSSDENAVQSKLIVNATLGRGRSERYTKVRYPTVDLREYDVT
jgi:2,5-furandicarboxylate decarboxylase 1